MALEFAQIFQEHIWQGDIIMGYKANIINLYTDQDQGKIFNSDMKAPQTVTGHTARVYIAGTKTFVAVPF